MIEKILPKSIAEELERLPETGMGYQVVNLKLRNGTTLRNVKVLNASIALLDRDVDLSQVKAVELQRGRAAGRANGRGK